MSVIEDYKSLKRTFEAIQREKDRRQGAVDQALYVLESEFECNTVEAAQKKLAKLKKEREKYELEAGRILASIGERYGHDLR